MQFEHIIMLRVGLGYGSILEQHNIVCVNDNGSYFYARTMSEWDEMNRWVIDEENLPSLKEKYVGKFFAYNQEDGDFMDYYHIKECLSSSRFIHTRICIIEKCGDYRFENGRCSLHDLDNLIEISPEEFNAALDLCLHNISLAKVAIENINN